MKKLYIVLSLILSLILVACTNNAEQEKHADKGNLNLNKTTQNFEVKLTSVKLIDNDLNTDVGHMTLELGVTAKNISKKTTDIGTGDFYLQDQKGKKYTFTGSEQNFGDLIKPDSVIKGKGYYSIPEDSKGEKMVVIYKPFKSTEQVKWDIIIPNSISKDKR